MGCGASSVSDVSAGRTQLQPANASQHPLPSAQTKASKKKNKGKANRSEGNTEIKLPEIKTKIKYTDLMPPSDDYEITKVCLYECIHEDEGDKEDDSDFFGGIKIEWTHLTNHKTHEKKLLLPDSAEIEADELTRLDYIAQIRWAQGYPKDPCIAYFALQPYMADIIEAGNAPANVNIVAPDPTKKLQLQGLKIGQGGPNNRIVSITPRWRGFTEDELIAVAEDDLKDPSKTPFLETYKSVNKKVFNLNKAYIYKDPANIYLEYKYLITHGEYAKEYLGGLPVRFLAVDERARFEKIVKDMGLDSLMTFMKEKKGLYKNKLEEPINKQATDLCVRVLREELLDNKLSIQDNIRFAEKVLTALYNDDQEMWKNIQSEVKSTYTTLKSKYFTGVIGEIKKDKSLPELTKIENYKDEKYATSYQKGCDQKVDEGEEEDPDKLVKLYIKEAEKIISEFHGIMRKHFEDKYLGAPIKQAERIKAKYEEYMKEDNKLSMPDALAKVMDFVRGTVVCHDAKEMVDTVNKLKTGFEGTGIQVVRLKNGFQDLVKENYKSILINVVAFESLICEVQVTLKSMKTFNDVDHFLYEVLRETCLYNFVAKYLNSYQPFKSWVEPFLDSGMKLIFPEKYVTWKGFYVYGGTREPMELKILLSKDGSLLGYGTDSEGDFTLEGTHKNYKEVNFDQIYEGDRSVIFTGKFVSISTLEGSFNDKEKGESGEFRMYVYDNLYPGLSITASVPYNRREKRMMRRREGLPDEEIKWEGFWIRDGTQGDMDLTMMLGKDGKVSGSGTDPNGDFDIEGVHENYQVISFTKFMDDEDGDKEYYTGELDENYWIKGKYDSGGKLGNFTMWTVDQKYWASENQTEEEWEGQYVYEGEQNQVQVRLDIADDGTISGRGCDDFGEFTVEGTHENFTKLAFAFHYEDDDEDEDDEDEDEEDDEEEKEGKKDKKGKKDKESKEGKEEDKEEGKEGEKDKEDGKEGEEDEEEESGWKIEYFGEYIGDETIEGKYRFEDGKTGPFKMWLV